MVINWFYIKFKNKAKQYQNQKWIIDTYNNIDISEKCKTGKKNSDPNAYVMLESTYIAPQNWQYGSVLTEKRELACVWLCWLEGAWDKAQHLRHSARGSKFSDPAFCPAVIMSLVLPVIPAKLQIQVCSPSSARGSQFLAHLHQSCLPAAYPSHLSGGTWPQG